MLAATALLMTAAAASAGQGEPEVARYAIVIGHNGAGGEGRAPLSFADDDAARFFLQTSPSLRRGWLLTLFDRDSARAFPDLSEVSRAPSRLELSRVLGELSWELRERRRGGERTEVLFYFAGHGDVDGGGEGFLVFSDGPFTRTDLDTQVVSGIESDTKHVILDACASYFMVARGGTESGRQRLTPALLDALRGPRQEAHDRTGVLVSTSDSAEVHESGRVGGGVFSFLLRSALAGGADINSDGRVEYVEAAAFIESASQHLGDARARLRVHAAPPAIRPHATLSDLAASGIQHFLVVDGGKAHKVRVLDARGVPLLEVHRPLGRGVTLALAGAPYFMVQVDEREAVLVPRRAGAYSLSSLRFEPAAHPRAVRDPVFAGLFRSPYDASFVAGFAAHAELPPPRRGAPFQPVWAPGGERPFDVPWTALGFSSLGASGVLVGLAIGATVGNALAFAELEESYRYTRAVDPKLAVAVEAWRTAAMAATVGAVALGLLGGGALAWPLLEEDAP